MHNWKKKKTTWDSLYIEVGKAIQRVFGEFTSAQMLEFIYDFGKPTAPLPAAMVPYIQTRVHVEDIDEIEFKISLDTQAPRRKRDS